MTATTSVASGPVIRVRDLRKQYGDIQAVDGVSFEVARGEIFGLLGPNGAGKTTTVEILEGLRTPDSGDVVVLGVDVAREPDALRERIGVSLQTAALYPKLTVTELIDLFRSFYPRSRSTNELIDMLELGERRNARSSELSGGQRQRLAVALALVNDPELVFLDEPTTGLDPAARRSLWDLIRGLKAAGRSVLLRRTTWKRPNCCATGSRSWTAARSWSTGLRHGSSSVSGSRHARSAGSRRGDATATVTARLPALLAHDVVERAPATHTRRAGQLRRVRRVAEREDELAVLVDRVAKD